MHLSWSDIERQPGFAGAEARAREAVVPVLRGLTPDSVDPEKLKKSVSRTATVMFVLYGLSFLAFETLLPDGFFWEFVKVVLFFALFFAFIALGLFFARHRLAALIEAAQARLRLKADAIRQITGPLGLTYVPAPGGAPKGLEWLAKQSWAPRVLREAAATLDAAGGMDEAVAVVRASGLLFEANTQVIGTAEQKAKLIEQTSAMRQIEDGFSGTRSGVAFDMFEWIESVSDAPDVIHLVIVLQAPLRLHGRTELRARRIGWPVSISEAPLQEVDLGPKAFDALYRLRASDQVEARAIFNPAVIERVIALAQGGKFRAVAEGKHLVLDFASEQNRFQLIDLITGVWSEDTIRQTHADLAEGLALVDVVAHAFMLRGASARPSFGQIGSFDRRDLVV
jgi:Protein of unknown function (DUF3137)